MGQKTITIKRPKYHPQTGVLLDGDYNFGFPVTSESLLITSLQRENSKLQIENKTLADQIKKDQAVLKELTEELDILRAKNLSIKECRQLRYKYREQVKLIKELRQCL